MVVKRKREEDYFQSEQQGDEIAKHFSCDLNMTNRENSNKNSMTDPVDFQVNDNIEINVFNVSTLFESGTIHVAPNSSGNIYVNFKYAVYVGDYVEIFVCEIYEETDCGELKWIGSQVECTISASFVL